MPASGAALPTPRPNPERTSGEQRRRLSLGPLVPRAPAGRALPLQGPPCPLRPPPAGRPHRHSLSPRSDLDGSRLPGPRWPGCTREPGHVRPAGPREASRAESVRAPPPGRSEPLRPVTPSKVQGLHPRPLSPGGQGSRPQQKAAPAEERGPALPKDGDPEGASRARARPDAGRPAPTPTPGRRGPDTQRTRVCWASHRGRGGVQAWRQARQGQGHRLQSLGLPTAVLMLARGVPGASQADATERGVGS